MYMSYFNSMDVSSSGLTAQRLRMDVISNNIANTTTSGFSPGMGIATGAGNVGFWVRVMRVLAMVAPKS